MDTITADVAVTTAMAADDRVYTTIDLSSASLTAGSTLEWSMTRDSGNAADTYRSTFSGVVKVVEGRFKSAATNT